MSKETEEMKKKKKREKKSAGSKDRTYLEWKDPLSEGDRGENPWPLFTGDEIQSKERCLEKKGAREPWRERSIFLSLGQWWHYWVRAHVASDRSCLSGPPEEWVETPLGRTGWGLHGMIRKSHQLPSPRPKITSLQACHQAWNVLQCPSAFELGHWAFRVLLLK